MPHEEYQGLPVRFTLEQAADRYFRLIAGAKVQLIGRFTPREMKRIIGVFGAQIWSVGNVPLATIVADDHVVNRLTS